MKVIITGGTGLIGSAITRTLLREGHTVTLLSRSKRTLPTGVKVIEWDPAFIGDWIATLDGADAVVNLSGESLGAGRWTTERKKRMVLSRVRSTETIVEAIARTEHRPRVLVNASAVGFYGHVEEDVLDESSPQGSDFLASLCGKWEAAASSLSSSGVRVVMMRTGFVIDAGADAFRRMVLPFKLFAGGSYGSGNQWFPWVHLEDAVAGYVEGIKNESLRGPVNLSSPNPVRVRELAREIGTALHRPSLIPAPALALKVILGEMSDLLLKGQRVIPRKLLDAGFTFRFPTIAEALKEATTRV